MLCLIHREREASARRAALQEIVSELSKTITRNGQRGVQRSFQALQAAFSISTEYLTNFQQGIQEPPQVCSWTLQAFLCSRQHARLSLLSTILHSGAISLSRISIISPPLRAAILCAEPHDMSVCVQVILRKLFEKLGATYIKLGNLPALLSEFSSYEWDQHN